MNRLQLMLPPLPWHRPRHRCGAGDRVVLLHGLWRSVWAMEALARSLNERGFETLIVPYSSFRKTLEEIVEQVAERIGPSDKPTHFVTHSMGGIVVRCLAARDPSPVTGQVVMLAPPNQGSEIIDWLEDSPIGRLSLGPGGMALATERVREEIPGFPEQVEVSVIMGRSRAMPLFHFLLQGDHDGVVTVSGGEVAGMTRLETVEADHTFIMGEPVVLERVGALLAR